MKFRFMFYFICTLFIVVNQQLVLAVGISVLNSNFYLGIINGRRCFLVFYLKIHKKNIINFINVSCISSIYKILILSFLCLVLKGMWMSLNVDEYTCLLGFPRLTKDLIEGGLNFLQGFLGQAKQLQYSWSTPCMTEWICIYD